jgi:hypothetical protein
LHEEIRAGWTPTTATETIFDPIESGESYSFTFANFENVDVTACKDYDHFDGRYTPIVGWTVYLSIDGVRQTPGQLTGADGCYTWTNLGPGHSYDVEEDIPSGWFAITPTSHDFGPAVSGEAYSYTFINSEYGYVELLKTFYGLIDPTMDFTFELYLGPDGFGGTLLASDSTFNDADGILDFGGYQLMPSQTYTICERDLPAGWTATWMLGGVAITPYNPDASSGEDLGNRCYDFSVGPAETAEFAVDNVGPPGDQRTPGYWKNWNTCTGGNQAETAAKNGGPDEGFFLVDDLLPIPLWMGDTTEFVISKCEVAVDILDRRKVEDEDVVKDGKKLAKDPAYRLAGNLLAAKLNLAAGAGSCQAIFDAVAEAEEILAAIGFDGQGTYFKGTRGTPPPDFPYTPQEVAALAGLIDEYNNGMLCTP